MDVSEFALSGLIAEARRRFPQATDFTLMRYEIARVWVLKAEGLSAEEARAIAPDKLGPQLTARGP